MTRMEAIRSKYLAGELSHGQAISALEALGMWEDDAAAYLCVATSTLPSQPWGSEK